MSSLSASWLELRAAYQEAIGEAVYVLIETGMGTGIWASLQSIESELSFDKVILYGGNGDKGGFTVDVLASDVLASALLLTKFSKVVSHSFGGITLYALASYINGANGSLAFTVSANWPGDAGNQITVTAVNPGANGVLAVAVNGKNITVTLATNGAGASITTALQFQTAMQASAAALALVTTVASGTGATVVPAFVLGLGGAGGRTMYLLEPIRVNNAVWTLHCGDPATLR